MFVLLYCMLFFSAYFPLHLSLYSTVCTLLHCSWSTICSILCRTTCSSVLFCPPAQPLISSAVLLPAPAEEIWTLWSSLQWGLQTCWAPASPRCSGTAGCLGDRRQSHQRRPPQPRYDDEPGSHTGTAAHGTSTCKKHTHAKMKHIQPHLLLSQLYTVLWWKKV